MTTNTITQLPDPQGFSADPLTELLRSGAQRLIEQAVVVIDEGFDLTFKIAGQVIVFQQNPVLHGLVPALDLTLRLRVVRCSANVIHSLPF